MKTIYLVRGFAGQYEDTRSWLVKAYVRKALAEHHAARAGQRGNEIVKKALDKDGKIDYFLWDKVMSEESNEFDKKFITMVDDYGVRSVSYFVSSSIELDETE
jgi:hypothetical protein